ncbi:hypothetical protein KIH13_22385 [Pseudomonas viridiflava]|nr:hypothetical protein KIH13_22385 [Pseudomonas viridiflava]
MHKLEVQACSLRGRSLMKRPAGVALCVSAAHGLKDIMYVDRRFVHSSPLAGCDQPDVALAGFLFSHTALGATIPVKGILDIDRLSNSNNYIVTEGER